MRLTKKLKAEVIVTMAKKILKKDTETIKAKLNAFAEKCYEHDLKKDIDTILNNVPADILGRNFSMGIRLPVFLQHKGNNHLEGIGTKSVSFNYGAGDLHVSHSHSCTIEKDGRPSTRHRNITLQYDHPLFKQAVALQKEAEAYQEHAKKCLRGLDAVINPCSTRAKLIEVLPEAEQYLPLETQQPTQVIPVSVIDDVRKMLTEAA